MNLNFIGFGLDELPPGLFDALSEEYTKLAEQLAKETGVQDWTLAIERAGWTPDKVQVRLAPTRGSDVRIERTFNLKTQTLDHSMFVLPRKFQRKGIADLVAKTSVAVMDRIKWKLIELEANLDVGGYAWLRKGFWPLISAAGNGGRKTLDFFIDLAHEDGKLSDDLRDRWYKLTDSEARAFVRSDDFRDYKRAFLGASWKGTADLDESEVRAALLRAVAPLPETPNTFGLTSAEVAAGQARLDTLDPDSILTSSIFKHEAEQANHLLGVVDINEETHPGRTQRLALADLVPTQDDAETKAVRAYLKGQGYSLGDKPLVIRFPDGKLYLQDGHHRVSALLLAGKTDVEARVLTVEEFDFDDDGNVRVKWSADSLAVPPPVVPVEATANEVYRDAAIRHQIGVRRYSAGLTRKVSALLEKADAELTLKLRERLVRFAGQPMDFTGERWKALLGEIRADRALALSEVRNLARSELGALSVMEGQREVSILASSIPISVELASVAADQMRAILTSKPFQGKLLGDWFKELEQGDQRRLTQALQLGLAEGQTIDEIVRRVIGTRANDYADGILAISRRDATAIVRTAVNHVSNTARNYVWEANSDIIHARVWVSTLDGRTSPICRARDGDMAPVGDNELPPGAERLVPIDARPPAHINCRSLLVAYIDGVGLLGNRPTVTDTRNRRKREIDFRQIAKAEGKSLQTVRAEWAAKNVGRVPSSTNYQEFLSRQSAAFQDEVLGKTKGRLFRQGGLTLDQFVDRRGNELTLSQLAATQPEAFTRAGLAPGGF